MIVTVLFLVLALVAAGWVRALVAADGRGQRPGPCSHRHDVDLDQHARLLELNR